MDQKLKADWIKALRSGEYRQGQAQLHNEIDNSYCCLGVLCKIAGASFEAAVQETSASSYDHVPVLDGKILSCGEDEELSGAFLREVGIDDQSELIILNDGVHTDEHPDYKAPQSFSVIADYIERNL